MEGAGGHCAQEDVKRGVGGAVGEGLVCECGSDEGDSAATWHSTSIRPPRLAAVCVVHNAPWRLH